MKKDMLDGDTCYFKNETPCTLEEEQDQRKTLLQGKLKIFK